MAEYDAADTGELSSRGPDFGISSLFLLILPVIAGVGLAWLDWRLAGAGWVLIQPLFALGTLAVLGQSPSLASAQARAALGRFLLVFLLLSAALIAASFWPAWQLLQTGSLGWALLLGLVLAIGWLLMWSRWPVFVACWLPALGWLAPGGRLRLLGLSRSLAVQSGRRTRVEHGDELPFGGLLHATLALLLLADGPLLLRFAESPWHWLAGAALAMAIYLLLFAAALRARRSQLRPTPHESPVQLQEVADEGGQLEPAIEPTDPTLALYAALRAARIDTALQQLEAGANVHALPAPDQRDQRSLLMLAALLSDLRPLRDLIARGADVNAVHGGLTALLAATRDSYQGRVEAAMTLLANGADPRLADAEGNTPLHHTARSSDPGVAALLLDAGADIEQENRAGLGPLAVACSCGNWRLARFLLDHGATSKGIGGQPPVIAAASGDDDPAGVRLLLKHKARINATGRFGRNALHAAALAGNAEVCAALLDAGADVNAIDDRGVTPLHEAARAGADAVIERLARAKPDANLCDSAGCNALNIACRSRRATVATLRALLALGVDPDHEGSDGKTPLQQALATGRWALVSTLDPSYQLPASVILDPDDAEALLPLPQRLLPLLIERRFDEVQAAMDHHPLERAEQRELALQLALHENGIAGLRWLWWREQVGDGAAGEDSLVFALIDRGGAAASALIALLESGASISGRAGLARYVQACVATEQASKGSENLALLLLDHGADASASADDGEVTLILAVRQGWLRLCERLLTMGVHPEARDRSGNTALQVACAVGLEPAVKLLVRFGADPVTRSPDGQTAQGMALSCSRRDLSRWLDWNVWHLPRRALRPADLCAAAAVGDRDAVERLLDIGLPINSVDAQSCSALLRASGNGKLAVVDLLLQRGADPAQPARSGATALSAAISMGHVEVVRTLLAAGARAKQGLPGGVSPLMIAAALGRLAVVNLLLDAGVDVERRDSIGNTALMAAAQYLAAHGRREEGAALLQRLLAADADADAVNQTGHTALLLLLGARQEAGARIDEDCVLDGVEKLLARGVDLTAQDRRGYGPLHLAALHGLSRVVSRLLAAGARPALRDTLGRSAHDIAVMRGFVDIAQLFEPRAQPSLARYLRTKDE